MRIFDVSCFPNAYRNSAATLRARIAEHGANSPLVRDWVIGQDAVLLNCYEDSSLPEELPPNAPAWLKADLAYQIAATYFYRLDYTRAGQLFAEIGRDASSPWQKTARYLVARCAVHAAIEDKTPKLIADAQQAIDALATDPQLADYRADAPKLASLLAFRNPPAGAGAGAGAVLACSRLAKRASRRSARLPAVGAYRHAQHGSRRVDL